MKRNASKPVVSIIAAVAFALMAGCASVPSAGSVDTGSLYSGSNNLPVPYHG
jgi:type IV pilus biogenesis protein CpaD/CtpE